MFYRLHHIFRKEYSCLVVGIHPFWGTSISKPEPFPSCIARKRFTYEPDRWVSAPFQPAPKPASKQWQIMCWEMNGVTGWTDQAFKPNCVPGFEREEEGDQKRQIARYSRRSPARMPGHPLYPSLPKIKESSVRFRVPSSQLPKVNTQRFKIVLLRGFLKYKVTIY